MDFNEERELNGEMNKNLIKAAPEMMKSFGDLHAVYEADSATSIVEKEMVAIGISITIKCIPCMLAHITTFKKVGGTREQLVDVVKTCILMNGGPGTAYGAKALAMYDELN
ncbi:MAG: carboxymuconolactone decarboxylase family protein [Ezakiella sp.]|nr:carboxymuconolactone decarboxylase family protein [Ezakiella sp.]MDD7471592.1 carboxymuconolactone decarboxylase family protein [Bacillota bacterium]MDY3923189.1 carboxymuconolactone decarboxylase family protein [Ezakiella sp.]